MLVFGHQSHSIGSSWRDLLGWFVIVVRVVSVVLLEGGALATDSAGTVVGIPDPLTSATTGVE